MGEFNVRLNALLTSFNVILPFISIENGLPEPPTSN
jgi:hypothetical protein